VLIDRLVPRESRWTPRALREEVALLLAAGRNHRLEDIRPVRLSRRGLILLLLRGGRIQVQVAWRVECVVVEGLGLAGFPASRDSGSGNSSRMMELGGRGLLVLGGRSFLVLEWEVG